MKTVFKTNIDLGELEIRYPQKGDEVAMTEYINTLSKEQTFITIQNEEITLAAEAKFLNEILVKIANKQAVMLLVFVNQKLSGIAQITMKERVEAHEGVIGISMSLDARGRGIGKLLFETLIKEAQKELPQLKVMTLGVFEKNYPAQNLYKKFGFKEFGRLPKGIKHKNEYQDHIYMYKSIELEV